MTKKRILIVGGVAGGAACAARTRRLCEQCEIVLFERGSFVSFANCGLPYYIGNVITQEKDLLVATPELFENRFNIQVCTETEVMDIDPDQKHIQVKDLNSGHSRYESYDALLLSTGAKAIWPPIPGIDLPGIHVLRTIPDSREILTALADAKHIVVVGAGYLGLELVENLLLRKLSVTVVEQADQVMVTLDREMSRFVVDRLREHQVEVKLNTCVTGFQQQEDGRLMVQLSDSEPILADLVMIAVGVKPETSLAIKASIELGELGGVRVNPHMQTSDPNIWAVGDMIEVWNVITERWQLLSLAGPANRQGRTAAVNIVRQLQGITDSEANNPQSGLCFRGVQATSVCSVFGLTVATTGACEKTLKQAGVTQYQKVYLHPGNHVGYYPGAKPIHIKLLFDTTNGRILGAQALGEADVARRIDVLSMAIQMQATVFDLEESELCYAPQFGTTKDPVNLAGMIAANHLRGDQPLAEWEQLADAEAQITGENSEADRLLSLIMQDPFKQVQIVDVRSPAEYASGHIPDAHNIPLDELRGRLHELSQAREIWVVCGVGQRAYNATRLLQQHGFNVKNLSGGMHTYNTLKNDD